MLKNFRTFNLSIALYRECQKIRLSTHLRDQLDRAASSVAMNLAEGYGKNTYKDQRKYFHIAMGSLREVQAILIISNKENDYAFQISDSVGASLFKLINKKP